MFIKSLIFIGLMTSSSITLASNSQEINNLGRTLRLTHYGEELFYSSSPEIISERPKLLKQCQKQEKESAHSKLLGCYISGANRMYILDSSRTKLKGIMESTAAHELLHALYSNLSSQQKMDLHFQIDQVLQGKNKKYLDDQIRNYHFASNEQMYNELHSFIGTDIESLPREIENHYAILFQDRKLIVQLSRNIDYQIEGRKMAMLSLDDQIKNLQTKIDGLLQQINLIMATINKQKSQLEELKNSNLISEHNELVLVINSNVTNIQSLNAERNELIAAFNSLVNQRNRLAQETNEIAQAVNSL